MNYKFFKIFSLIIITSVLFLVSCEPDDVEPEDPRDDFAGSWLCTENTNVTYTVVISKDPAKSTQILLNNFHHLGTDEVVLATIAGSSVVIPKQNVCDNTMEVNGNGYMETKSKISFDYYVNDFADIDTIHAVYTK